MVPFKPFLSNLCCKKLKPFAPIVRLVIFKLLNSLANKIRKKKYAKNFIRKKSKILRFPGTAVPESTDSPNWARIFEPLLDYLES